ncbi:MAG TPA: hypothetical protein VNL98_12720 [Gemmatimonadales bacterium]|nr:hypothetical protein [Gemmatimonadales bacterium]
MVDTARLKELVGKTVELRFLDGHHVIAELTTVDLEVPQEITYKILRVVAVGPPKFSELKPGQYAAADPRGLESVTSK